MKAILYDIASHIGYVLFGLAVGAGLTFSMLGLMRFFFGVTL